MKFEFRYKSELCSQGTKCNRPFCFFAHTENELRQARNKEFSSLYTEDVLLDNSKIRHFYQLFSDEDEKLVSGNVPCHHYISKCHNYMPIDRFSTEQVISNLISIFSTI